MVDHPQPLTHSSLTMAKPLLPPGTIVCRQSRGLRDVQMQARIVDSFTTSDRLGRRQIWYRCQLLNTGVIRDWPGSHVIVVSPAPASA